MSKLIKRGIIILASIAVLGFISMSILKYRTKKHSPEHTIEHISKGSNFSVFYNRPYKKGRKIFGGLVPFDEVWRTGANEATTFTTDNDVFIDGTKLKAGTYSLWTIPSPNSWKVIFNDHQYGWGVDWKNGKSSRDPKHDVLTIEVPVQPLLNIVEQFSIYFQEANDFTLLYLAWDQTAIAIPITLQ